jgi:hypothetical protein
VRRAAVATLAAAVAAALTPSSTASSSLPARDDALSLLTAAARAVREQPYAGRQVIAVFSRQGGRTLLLDVRHVPGQGSQVRLVATPQTPERRYFAPDRPAGAGAVGGLDARALKRLVTHHTPVVAGRGVVAGRPAVIVELRRRSGSVAVRLWLDERTRLPLQRDVLDPAGRLLRTSLFAAIDLRPQQTRFPRAAPRPTRAGAAVDAARLTDLRERGWAAPERLPENLDLVEARLSGSGRGQVLHLGYSDGVSLLSVFEQPGRLDPGRLAGWTSERRAGRRVWVSPAVPEQVTWSAAGRVFTVISESPEAVDLALAALPRPRSPGVLPRVGRGLSRVVSWVNPLG